MKTWVWVMLVITSAQAQDAKPPVLINKMTPDDLVAMLKEQGFSAEKVPGSDKSEFVKFRAEGYLADAFIVDSNTTILLYSGFTDMQFSLEKVNEWNVSHRFCRAYMDSSIGNRPALECDVDLSGITRDYLLAQIGMFRDTVGIWAHFCIDATAEYNKTHPATPKNPSSPPSP